MMLREEPQVQRMQIAREERKYRFYVYTADGRLLFISRYYNTQGNCQMAFERLRWILNDRPMIADGREETEKILRYPRIAIAADGARGYCCVVYARNGRELGRSPFVAGPEACGRQIEQLMSDFPDREAGR